MMGSGSIKVNTNSQLRSFVVNESSSEMTKNPENKSDTHFAGNMKQITPDAIPTLIPARGVSALLLFCFD